MEARVVELVAEDEAGALVMVRDEGEDPDDQEHAEHMPPDRDVVEQPEEAITRWKLLRMARGLETFAIDNDLEQRPMRLDVVAIVLNLDGSVQRLDHLRSVYPG